MNRILGNLLQIELAVSVLFDWMIRNVQNTLPASNIEKLVKDPLLTKYSEDALMSNMVEEEPLLPLSMGESEGVD